MKRLLIIVTVAALATIASAGAASAQYQPMFITVTPTTVPVGGTFSVTAGYFEPGAAVEIRLGSVVLGSLVARADGTVAGSFVVPASVNIGAYPVVATGARLGTGVSTSVQGNLTVVAAAVAPTSTVSTATAAASTLPVTGTDPQWLVAAGAGLLLLGGLAVIGTRRRSTAS